MYVEKVETNKITVKRGFAGTTAAALEDNDPLFVIGAVAEEGDTSFAARSANPTKVTNYTQIWRTSIDESESMLSSDNQTTPHDWVYQHKKKMIEHLKDLEHAALFGSKGKTTGTNGRRVSTSGGALSFLTANNQDMGGTMTEAELESWVRSITRYGSKTKTVLAARLPLSVINAFATGKLSDDSGRQGHDLRPGDQAVRLPARHDQPDLPPAARGRGLGRVHDRAGHGPGGSGLPPARRQQRAARFA
jgi:hypothetical protein